MSCAALRQSSMQPKRHPDSLDLLPAAICFLPTRTRYLIQEQSAYFRGQSFRKITESSLKGGITANTLRNVSRPREKHTRSASWPLTDAGVLTTWNICKQSRTRCQTIRGEQCISRGCISSDGKGNMQVTHVDGGLQNIKPNELQAK